MRKNNCMSLKVSHGISDAKTQVQVRLPAESQLFKCQLLWPQVGAWRGGWRALIIAESSAGPSLTGVFCY